MGRPCANRSRTKKVPELQNSVTVNVRRYPELESQSLFAVCAETSWVVKRRAMKFAVAIVVLFCFWQQAAGTCPPTETRALLALLARCF